MLCRRVRHSTTKNRCPGYDTKLHLIVRFQFWSIRKYGVTYSLPLLPGPLWPGVLVYVRVPSIGQIENVLRKDLHKKCKCEQTMNAISLGFSRQVDMQFKSINPSSQKNYRMTSNVGSVEIRNTLVVSS